MSSTTQNVYFTNPSQITQLINQVGTTPLQVITPEIHANTGGFNSIAIQPYGSPSPSANNTLTIKHVAYGTTGAYVFAIGNTGVGSFFYP